MSAPVEVVRAFYFEGAPRQPGEVLVVSPGFAAELISLGKARAAQPKPQEPRRRPRRAEPELILNDSET